VVAAGELNGLATDDWVPEVLLASADSMWL
jgi:hypothetical protein